VKTFSLIVCQLMHRCIGCSPFWKPHWDKGLGLPEHKLSSLKEVTEWFPEVQRLILDVIVRGANDQFNVPRFQKLRTPK
jgi:hypothetical protein